MQDLAQKQPGPLVLGVAEEGVGGVDLDDLPLVR
jgi:hypothetical protein